MQFVLVHVLSRKLLLYIVDPFVLTIFKKVIDVSEVISLGN